jgi:hypothetical protein
MMLESLKQEMAYNSLLLFVYDSLDEMLDTPEFLWHNVRLLREMESGHK